MNCKICKSRSTSKSYFKDNYRYYYCVNCRTYFVYPMPNIGIINAFYKNKFSELHSNEKERIKNRAIKIIRRLVKMNPKASSILDIGCGDGILLNVAKEKGFNRILGIDSSYRNAVKVKNSYDIEVKCLYLNNKNFRLIKERFDIVILSHLIEHVINPRSFIEEAAHLLNKNGILYIETPNSESYLIDAEKENFTFLTPPEHLFLLSKDSFNNIVKENKLLKLVYIETYTHVDHVLTIVKHLVNLSKTENKPDIGIINTNNKELSKNKILVSKIKNILLKKLLSKVILSFINKNNKGSFLALYIQKR